MTQRNITGYKGVYKKGNRYTAVGWINRQGHYLGYFDTAQEASKAYLEWEASPKKPLRSEKDERSSPEMLEIVENVFRRLIKNDRSRG